MVPGGLVSGGLHQDLMRHREGEERPTKHTSLLVISGPMHVLYNNLADRTMFYDNI